MRTCRTCKHHFRDVFCAIDWCSKPAPEDERIGKKTGAQWCINARSESGLRFAICGPDGRLWEEKKTTFSERETSGWNLFSRVRRWLA